MKKIMFAVLTGVFALACSSADKSTNVFTTTVVRMNPDGTTSVYRYVPTDEQLQREIAAKVAHQKQQQQANADGIGQVSSAIFYDANCAAQDIWMYDQANGYGNRLCLQGEGTYDLSGTQDVSCDQWSCSYYPWSSAIRSYWPGYGTYGRDGYFTDGIHTEWFYKNDPLRNTVPPPSWHYIHQN